MLLEEKIKFKRVLTVSVQCTRVLAASVHCTMYTCINIVYVY